jgi:ATP-dependent helicase HepA
MIDARAVSKLVGKFVNDVKYGPAKVVAIEKGRYKLEYFFSPWNRMTGWTTSAKVESIRLLSKTRVYVESNGRWQSGRIGVAHPRSDKGCDYDVEFPNKVVARFPEEQIFCRCWSAHDDPTSALAVGGGETQYWHEHRHRFTSTVLAQRSACRGLASFLSSRIELVPHQVEVARRVLEDPLQRYLLADEVGMGKTIEAGIVIRQFLLSNPKGGHVWILVPERLMKQWERELVSKFATDEFTGRVHVFDVDRLNFLPIDPPDLLVIDEAHHVVASQVPHALLKLAIRTPRLLLLSATPALGQTEVLLRLLRIIDPDGYSETTLDDFRDQVDKREAIGIFLRGLRADANPAVLRQRLRTLPSLFPNDSVALSISEEISGALAKGDVDALRRLTPALRSHIADVHRIHHRLIRTRRRDAAAWVFRSRGPVVVKEEPDLTHVRLTWVEDTRMAGVVDLFEQWRMEAVVASDSESAARAEYEKWAVLLFEAIGIGVDRLGEILESVPDFILSNEWKVGFKGIIGDENGEPPRAEQVAADIRRYLELLKTQLHAEHPRVVVFGSDNDDVHRCAQATAALLGNAKVMFASSLGAEEVSMAFLEDEDAQVLFCGKAEEEGLNLHFVDAIVHLDLPLSPTRVEQRIGRVDRFGRRTDVIQQRVVLPDVSEDMSLWEAWYEILSRGFHVFNNPIADVQFSLDAINRELVTALLQRGAAGLREAISSVQGRLIAERDRLDNQYALDKVLQEEAQDRLFNDLENLEADESALITATSGWLFRSLLFQCKGDPQKVFKVEWDVNGTLLPAWPWAQVFKAGLEGMHTFKRRYAVQGKYGIHPRLLRIGSPLLNSLERECRWDDRGTAFATWRHIPSLPTEVWIGFKLCYVIEARLPSELSPGERQAYAARMDAYLPPWTETIYMDAQLQLVSDSQILALLALPYEKGRDTNLGGRLEILDALIDQQTFDHLCHNARSHSETWLRETEKYKEIVRRAVENGTFDINRRITRLQQRRNSHLQQNANIEEGIDREIAINESLPGFLGNPLVKLDGIGLIVLSSRSPSEFIESA